MIVMITAITPSLNASSRPLPIVDPRVARSAALFLALLLPGTMAANGTTPSTRAHPCSEVPVGRVNDVKGNGRARPVGQHVDQLAARELPGGAEHADLPDAQPCDHRGHRGVGLVHGHPVAPPDLEGLAV